MPCSNSGSARPRRPISAGSARPGSGADRRSTSCAGDSSPPSRRRSPAASTTGDGGRGTASRSSCCSTSFPRNIYRGTARAFAGDPRARELAHFAVARGFDRTLPATLRTFFYLPLEHSESLADQELVVRLFDAYGGPGSGEYGRKHREIIRRFGRFPHRNAVLGRPSTPEEEAFAADPENRFGQ